MTGGDMSPTNRRSEEGGFTIVYTNEARFDQQSKRRVRTHAATWGRAHGARKPTQKPRVPQALALKDPDIFTKSTVPRTIKKEDADGPGDSLTTRTAKKHPSATLYDALYFGSKFDAFQALPQLPLEQARPEALAVVKSHMSTVLGEEFVRQNLPLNAAQSNAMYVGSLLITYARNYALTGRLSGPPQLLELKGEVIKIVNASLQKSGTAIDLESLYAIFVLSAPVVCLTTTQLPSSRVARKSLFEAQKAASPAAVQDSLAEEIAFRDHLLHRQTVLRILIERGPDKLRQAKIGRKFLAYFIL